MPLLSADKQYNAHVPVLNDEEKAVAGFPSFLKRTSTRRLCVNIDVQEAVASQIWSQTEASLWSSVVVVSTRKDKVTKPPSFVNID